MSRIAENRRSEERRFEDYNLAQQQLALKKNANFQKALHSDQEMPRRPNVSKRQFLSKKVPIYEKALTPSKAINAGPSRSSSQEKNRERTKTRAASSDERPQKSDKSRKDLVLEAAVRRNEYEAPQDFHGGNGQFCPQAPIISREPVQPVATKAGLIPELTRKIIEKTIELVESTHAEGCSSMSVHFSAELGGGLLKVSQGQDKKLLLYFSGLDKEIAFSVRARRQELRARLERQGHHLGGISFS